MTLMRIEERWRKLIPSEDKPIFQLLDATHPLRFYIGKEMSGELLFLLVAEDRPPVVRNMRAVSIRSFERSDGDWSLLFRLDQNELANIFGLLCEDLVNATRSIPRNVAAMRFVSNRLRNWRRLLEVGQHGILSSDEVRGLFGELLVLGEYISSGIDANVAVRAWSGPFGADQDFQFSDIVCEVKTIHPTASSVIISSERQLYSEVPKFVLHVVALEEDEENGQSLNSLVGATRSALFTDIDALAAFDERINEMGYLMRDEYNQPILNTAYEARYNVSADFPRFAPTDMPIGVSKLRYHISLAHCEQFKIKESSFGECNGT